MVVSYITGWVICYHIYFFILMLKLYKICPVDFLKLAPVTLRMSPNFLTCLLIQDALFSSSRFLLVQVVFRNQGQDTRYAQCYCVCRVWEGRRVAVPRLFTFSSWEFLYVLVCMCVFVSKTERQTGVFWLIFVS